LEGEGTAGLCVIDPVPLALCLTGCLAGGLAIASLRPAAVTDHPRLVLCLLSAVTLGAAAALVRLDPPGFTIDVDPASEPLIRSDDPGIPIYAQAKRDFGNDDVYVIAMETRDVFTPENLEVLRRLTHRIRGLPRIAAVESLARVLSVRYDAERDAVTLDRFMRRVPADPDELAELRERALSDRIYRKTLVSDAGRAAAINITFQPMTDAEFVDLDLDGRIEAMLREESSDDRRFYVAGRPHVRSQAYHIMVGDMARLVPIAVAIAAFVLWLMAGSLRGALIPLVACLTATLWVFGAMAALRIDINLITLVTGPMMICIGGVYGVHVHARYELIAAEAGGDARASALACLRYARTPVLMAGCTTCIGFGALLLSDIPATNELGYFSILGVASVTLISLTGVPAALVLLPVPAGSGRIRHRGTRPGAWFRTHLDGALARLGDLVVAQPNRVLAVAALVTAGALVSLPRIAVDTDFITFFLEDSRVRTDFARVNRLLTGAVPIYVPISGREEGDFREPATLKAVERLQARLESLPGVSEVLSSVDFIRVANRAIRGGSEAADRIPESRAAVAEAMFLLPKSNLRRFATSNHSRANLIVRTGRSGSAAVRELEADIREVLGQVDLPPGFETEVIGNVILINRSADGIAANQALQVGFAAAAILALICLVFRSVRVGLIAMVPNVVPVLIFFGVLGAGAAPLSLPTSLIGSIALGIAIDDTMHFLVAYLTRRSRGLSPPDAARACIQRVGRPIVMTSVMLVVGFLVIVTSGFATLREFGYLTALTMAICLCTDLVLFPALLVRTKA
jgi:predicted RND superfamily exporter protein